MWGRNPEKPRAARKAIGFPTAVQPSYFQRYMWKSLWKKAPDSDWSRKGFASEVPPPPWRNSKQVLHFQYGTECSRIRWQFPSLNRMALSFSHLLHSLPPRGWLRVTRNRICIIHQSQAPNRDTRQIDFRIVPLTCPGSRTILAASTREVAGERPQLFFRE